MSLLELKDLSIHYFTDEGVVKAVNGLTLSVGAEKRLGWSAKPARENDDGFGNYEPGTGSAGENRVRSDLI